MEQEFIHGKMDENMKGNSNTINDMEMVYIHGLMEDDMMGNGLMVNKMVKVIITFMVGRLERREFGKRGNELRIGSRKKSLMKMNRKTDCI